LNMMSSLTIVFKMFDHSGAYAYLVSCTGVAALMNVGYALSFLIVDPSQAMLLISLHPVWTAVISTVCLHQSMSSNCAVALALAVISAALPFLPSMLDPNSLANYHLFLPFGTGICVSVFVCLTRKCASRHPHISMEPSLALASGITLLSGMVYSMHMNPISSLPTHPAPSSTWQVLSMPLELLCSILRWRTHPNTWQL